MTQEQLDLWKVAILIEKKKPKCICGKPLKGSGINYYEHEGGVHIVGEKEKQWVYVHCDECGFDMALWKIWRELQ
jgi:hypothetical protein